MDQAIPMNKSFFGKATTGKLGMWLFIVMDGLTFGAIIIGGLGLRISTETWPIAGSVLNVPLTAFNTFLLICSSFTMVMALNSILKDDQNGLIKYLAFTIAGGVMFLGIQVWEYSHFIMGGEHLGNLLAAVGIPGDQFLPTTGIYGSVFYVTTMFHGLHVLSGVIYLSVILSMALKQKFSADNYDRVEIAGLFWHFIDLVWILVFTIIYLI
ncbi:MAG: heme-copper oxidase subunit III [Candidatus Marinimicrobia bacterium]|jgi:heme/copper-type cytochrome/quinol oxidase subunit 3|nr:heme-copper oxidase subunit III [Candidatus Neomarinimicrobiota bacterium]MBT3617576.1 heme-copper oxidase subunit III [Candidatus Neomarinimicrobiota bacterium]MBT3829253.1 heme-copper oxidase subunit III [Candidatus Neomarinimicrobiota bacterium]MBT4280377.1 heme-copper oxidase subunit III [Candidatus Neomarinimicrobiota bacterium]MBT4569871.1 heme-copper oxidase subunit III [Candidatus Neomarinimicrobiota bacterium]